MSFILPSNKFEILICPLLSLDNNNNNNNNNNSNNINNNSNSNNSNNSNFTHETLLYEKLKNNYESFFHNNNCDIYKSNHFEEQLNYLYKKTMDHSNLTSYPYDNSMFYEINEFIIKHNIFKNNVFKKNNVFIVSNYINEILDAMKGNEVEYDNYFTYSSFNDNFSKNINQNEHIFDFMFFDILLKEINETSTDYFRNFITSVMIILNYLKKNGKCIVKINLDIYNKISEFIYFLSYLFENITIIQLESSDNTSLFIQCNDFIINDNRNENYNKNIIMFFFLLNKLKSCKNARFISLFQTRIPYFFNTKLNNIRNIILQQKMEVIYNLNNYFYSNHKQISNNSHNSSLSSLSSLSSSNICLMQKLKNINNQKIKRTISWCKKYNISYTT